MSYDIKMSQLPKVERSPQQKKLNRLIDQIEQQKQELAAWKNAQADIRNYTRSKLLPVYSELHTVLFAQLDTLWKHLASDAFSKVDLAQIDTKNSRFSQDAKKISDANFRAERTGRESGYFLYAACRACMGEENQNELNTKS